MRQNKANLFVDSMTLLQMTYMGVLESIEVKQKNFPYRRRFDEFYKRYEDLCPSTASKRFKILVEEKVDFKKLCKEILNSTLRGLADELFAFGHHKIFLKNELALVLEKARYRAQEKKSKSVNIIQKCFQIKMVTVEHQDKMIKVKRIQRFWRKRGEIVITSRAKEFLEKAKDGILKYKMLVDKERTELEAKKKIVKIFRLNVLRQKLGRYAICNKQVLDIFTNAWILIREDAEKKSALNVQRIFKGFLEKKKHKSAIEAALQVRYDCASTKAFRIIQKTFRGVLVRDRMRTLHLSAAYIQGYMRMRWLSTLFQKLRFEVRKIQKCVRKFLIRKNKMKERLSEFIQKELSLLENVKNVENYAMFGDTSTDSGRDNFFQNHTPYNMKKVNLFSQIVDVHIL